MGDATRPPEDAAGELTAARDDLSGLVGELTHAVLGLLRSRGFGLADRIRAAGGDPLEVIDLIVETLRALADRLETPDAEWGSD